MAPDDQILVVEILTPRSIMCEGATLAESSKQKVPSPTTPDKLSPDGNETVLSAAYFFFASHLPHSPLTPVFLLLSEPLHAFPINRLAAQICKCWVLLFAVNHKHAVHYPDAVFQSLSESSSENIVLRLHFD